MEKKILEILKENYFEEIPKEISILFRGFIDWLAFGDHLYYPAGTQDSPYWEEYNSDTGSKLVDFNDIFQYWLDNIHNK